MPKLNVGDVFLNVRILNSIDVAVFPNKDKKEGEKTPDYKGDGIAIWVNHKKAPTEPEKI